MVENELHWLKCKLKEMHYNQFVGYIKDFVS